MKKSNRRLSRLIFSGVVLFCLLAIETVSLAAVPLALDTTNSRDHLIINFQTAIIMERILEELHVSKPYSLFWSTTLTLTGALAKEALFDSHIDSNDLWIAIVGTSLSNALALAWPDQSGSNPWLRFEPEIGPVYINTLLSPNGAAPPPPSLMFRVQTTFWIKQVVGLHLFSGGLQLANSSAEDREQRLLLGGGLRFPLFPWIWNMNHNHSKSPFSSWVGIDYGYLLFSLDSESVSYKPSARVPFFTVGLRWKPSKSKVQLSLQGGIVPYDGNVLYTSGLNIGLDL